TPVAGRPDSSVQDPMGVRAAALRRQAHHPQRGGAGAGPGRQHRASEPALGMAPDSVRKAWRKGGPDPDDRFWRGRPGVASSDCVTFGRAHLSSGTSHAPADSKWPKSSLNLVFDLAGVVVRYDQAALIARVFPDPTVHARVHADIIGHGDRLALDRGTLSE